MSHRSWFKAVAITLASALVVTTAPIAAVPPSSEVTGSVFASGGQAPITGAIVHLAEAKTGALYSSAPSSSEGAFRLGDLPAGTYEIGIQTGRDLYLVKTPLTLAPGQARNVDLAVDPNAKKTDEDDDRDKGMTGWNNPLVASLIVVGSAIVVGVAIDSATGDNEPAGTPSPSSR